MLEQKIKLIFLMTLLSSDKNVLKVLADEMDSVKIVFYFGPTNSDHQSYYLDDVTSLLKHPSFIHKKTSCYMHGYTNNQDDHSTKLLVKSYLKRNTSNFLTIDYAALVNGTYISAQENLLKLVPRLADSFLDLFDAGLDKNSFSLVGLSLGGIGVGLIGREVQKQSNGSVILPRITCLDPSNPAAHAVFILPPVEMTDAKFVDVIHTSAGDRGTAAHTGHADFWPNGGKPIQPGCPDVNVNKICSHLKSYAYWAQSVANVNTEQLWAYPAQSYEDFLTNEHEFRCEAIPMGIDCPACAFGDYYLKLDSRFGETGDPTVLSK